MITEKCRIMKKEVVCIYKNLLSFIFCSSSSQQLFFKTVTSHKGGEKTGIWTDGLNKDSEVYLPQMVEHCYKSRTKIWLRIKNFQMVCALSEEVLD